MTSCNIMNFRNVVAKLEAQGFACTAWQVKGTGDVNIVYGISLDTEWIVAMASKNAELIY